MLDDLRYAFRNLRNHRGYTFVIVLTLGLAIGGSTAVFSVVNGVLLRALPYKSSERLVMIWNRYGKQKITRAHNSPPDFLDRKIASRTLQNLAAIEETSMNLIGKGEPRRLRAARVSASLFRTLGISPAIGRDFAQPEDRPGSNSVVILSYDFWKTQFGSDRAIIGKTLNLSGTPHVVIGIMPKSFWFPRPEIDLWTPIAFTQEQLSNDFRGNEYLEVVARIKPKFNLSQVESEMNQIAQSVITRVPERREFLTSAGWGAIVIPVRDWIVGEVRPALFALMGAVSFLLLIGCANVANLILARNSAREKEFGIRVALGADRMNLVRLIFLEGLLLAFAGGLIGLLLTFLSTRVLPLIAPDALPRVAEITIDIPVLAYSLVISFLTAVFIVAIPALRKSLDRPMQSLNVEGTSSPVKSLRRMGDALLISQIALALVLATGAGLLIKSFEKLTAIHPGFETENRLTFSLSLPELQYSEDARVVSFYQQLLEQIRIMPGVQAAGANASLPIAGENWTATFHVEEKPLQPGEPEPGFEYRMVTPNYFRSMGIPFRNGRDFNEFDKDTSTRVVIIDEALANRYWKKETPIGKRIGFSNSRGVRWREIVGVVGHVRNAGVKEEGKEQVYLPHSQLPERTMSVVVHTNGRPSNVIPLIRARLRDLDPNLPVNQIRTMDEVLSGSLAQPRFNTVLLAMFAGLAIVLAAIGIYAVFSYSVSQRRKEIGIRMALGAKPENVLFMIVKQSITTSFAGMIAGIAASIALSRFIRGLLFGTLPVDPAIYALAVATVIFITVLATSMPAKRAAELDPLQTLREA